MTGDGRPARRRRGDSAERFDLEWFFARRFERGAEAGAFGRAAGERGDEHVRFAAFERFGLCLLLFAVKFNMSARDIVSSALILPITAPSTRTFDTDAPEPHSNAASTVPPPVGRSAVPACSGSVSLVALAIVPSSPSSGARLTSPLVAPSSWQEPLPGRSQPDRKMCSSSVFAPVYSPLPVALAHVILLLPAVSSVSAPPLSVRREEAAPAAHSNAPLWPSAAFVQLAFAYAPCCAPCSTGAARQRPRSGRLSPVWNVWSSPNELPPSPLAAIRKW